MPLFFEIVSKHELRIDQFILSFLVSKVNVHRSSTVWNFPHLSNIKRKFHWESRFPRIATPCETDFPVDALHWMLQFWPLQVSVIIYLPILIIFPSCHILFLLYHTSHNLFNSNPLTDPHWLNSSIKNVIKSLCRNENFEMKYQRDIRNQNHANQIIIIIKRYKKRNLWRYCVKRLPSF